ncbi:MAG: aspartate kinase [Acidobacteria bacterium]|nr:aspartate kinase [Acidobacteriota bacterium]
MTGPLVMKFGGTSVAGAAAMTDVARIVKDATAGSRHIVVVVSAMSGVTDALLAACRAARDGGIEQVERHLPELQSRHLAVVNELFADAAIACDIAAEVTRACDELRGVLTSVAILQELTPRGADRVTAAGELLSSRIVATLLRESGIPARWIDARRAVVSDAGFGAAWPDLAATTIAAAGEITPAWQAGEVGVTGGFLPQRQRASTTLGRGGSDVSAAVLGAALDAAEIQIWTDVDGMLTADPRVVHDAQPVGRLSFDEAAELAYFGAKVLHPSTILPAVEKNIPVRILNTLRPGNPGSLITADGGGADRALTAIACKRNVTVVNVTSTRMLHAHGFLRKVLRGLRAPRDLGGRGHDLRSERLDDAGR